MTTMAAAATNGFMLADTLPTPGFFTAAIAADENHNPFENSFREGNASADRNRDALDARSSNDDNYNGTSNLTSNPSSNNYVNSLDATFSPMFGFSSGGTSPAPMDLNVDRRENEERHDGSFAPSSAWGGSKQDKHLGVRKSLLDRSQEPSPPHSSSHSPESWTYGNLPQDTAPAPLQQILTKESAIQTRSVHGQITPPNHESPNPILPGGAFIYNVAFSKAQGQAAQAESQSPTAPSSSQATSRRKRSSQANPVPQATEATEPPKKERRRRSSTKSTAAQEAELAEAEDDAKRSRFLERNRLAASKCRQKKKEWTKGLEERARDLQNEKMQLQMMVGSLKSEMIYVREELLKHGNCGCERIREYLNTEVNALAQNQGQLSYLMRDIPSRHCSMTPSTHGGRRDSLMSYGSRRESMSVDSSVDTPIATTGHDMTGNAPDSRSPIRDRKSDDSLRALIVAQLNGSAQEDVVMQA